MVETALKESRDVERAIELVDQCIGRHWPEAELKKVEAVPGDASSRRYLRCLLQTGRQETPPSVVVMLLSDAAVSVSSEELGVFGAHGPSELPFLNVYRFLTRITDAVPEVYLVADDERAVVLEDVGDVPLWEAATGTHTEELFGRALELLANIQRAAVDDGSGCYAFEQAFDERLFGWEFEHFIEYGLASAPPSDLKRCHTELTAIAQRLGNLPRVFCHRDYHAWNIHVQDERLRLIDFQDALQGPALYDVASLLTDRFTPERVDLAMEERLLSRFADRELAGGEPAEIYRLCAFQRVLKVVGRFNYLSEEKHKRGYLRMLPRVVATARRLAHELDSIPVTRQLLEGCVKAGPDMSESTPVG